MTRVPLSLITATSSALMLAACNFSVDPTLVRGTDDRDGGANDGAVSGGEENTTGGNGNTTGGNGNTTGGDGNTTGGNGNTTGGDGNTTGGNGNTTGGDGNTTGGSANTTGGDGNTTGGSANTTGGNGSPTGGTTDGLPDRCLSDAECGGADKVCVPNNEGVRDCAPRCTVAGECVASDTGGRMLTFASDGTRVCYGVHSATDESGLESARNATIYAWDLGTAPVAIATGFEEARVKQLVDGHCYVATENGVVRVALDGKSSPATLSSTRATYRAGWTTPTHVWWSAFTQFGGQIELWRVGRGGAGTAQLVTTSPTEWTSGNSTHLFRGGYGSPIRRAPISDLTQGTNLSVSGYPLAATDSSLYITDSENNATHVDVLDLNATSTPAQRVPAHMTGSDLPPLDGDWVYWSQLDWSTTTQDWWIRFFRMPMNAQFSKEELLRLPGNSAKNARSAFSVAKNRVVFERGARLVAVPIAPSPCSPTVDCAFGTTCATDMTCK